VPATERGGAPAWGRVAIAATASVACVSVAAAPVARAQTAGIRWDVGAEAGAVERFRTGAPPGAPRPEVGPSAEVHAHVAVFPMLRAGVYVAYDASPAAGRPVRQFLEGGIRVKFTPPLLRRPWRVWAFAGLGGAWVVEPGFRVQSFALATSSSILGAGTVSGAEGGILEVPLGVGLGWTVRAPWRLFAELGGRATWLAAGPLYEPPFCLCRVPSEGKDSFAAGVSVGVSWEQ
jgi:hypothetical protein